MLKLSQLLDAKRRDSSETMSETSSPQSRQPPQSPLTINSSAPVSPAVSLFSAKGHSRFSSSVSSLVSSPGMRASIESSSKNHLTGVKEEPCGLEARDLEHEYFQHFDQGLSEDTYFACVDYTDGYDLTDTAMDVAPSPKKRRSDSVSMKGISRISSQISTISSRFKTRRVSEDPDAENGIPDDLRSRTNSATSAIASPMIFPLSRVDSSIPPSPARTIFEERLSESGAQPIDIGRANSQSLEDPAPKATTPLLPPFMGENQMNVAVSQIHSPLQSPSVADVSDDGFPLESRWPTVQSAVPSPPLSSKPSVASFSRPRASTSRTVSGDAPHFLMTDPNDEWANKLGHANFSIQPEPYVPEVCDLESFRQLRADWDVAQCNFTKHLVRTGEHYGITSNIYKLTQDKWESINREWKHHHEAMVSDLEVNQGPMLTLTKSNLDPCEDIKIPRLHDNKFPELGDGEIVGPMKIAPATGPCRRRSLKRNFLKFFQDLVGRS